MQNKFGVECYAIIESENILAYCFSDFFQILRKIASHDDIHYMKLQNTPFLKTS